KRRRVDQLDIGARSGGPDIGLNEHVVDLRRESKADEEHDQERDQRLDQPRTQLDQVLDQRRPRGLDLVFAVLEIGDAHAALPSSGSATLALRLRGALAGTASATATGSATSTSAATALRRRLG